MNENKLRVLYISSWYPNRVKPLLGIFVKRHAAALAKKCSVGVIYVCSDENEGIEETTEDGIYTIRVYYKRVASQVPFFAQWRKYKEYSRAWEKAINLYKQRQGIPDIISCNVVMPVALIALRLKKKWNVPFTITEHWTGYFPEDGRYKGLFMKSLAGRAVKNASAVITVSNALKTKMQQLGLANTYHVISNVVDIKMFDVAANKLSDRPFRFIHVSSLDEEQKNVSGIIRAFGESHKMYPTARLTIVGSGEEKRALEKLTEILDLKNQVEFAGQKTGIELAGLFQQADAFVLFSNYENLPCVMLEAMSCGLPVIGTKVGDVPEYINTSNGLLVDSHNEKQLCSAMTEMIQNKGKYDASEIRKAIVGKVNEDAVAEAFLQVYKSVLNK